MNLFQPSPWKPGWLKDTDGEIYQIRYRLVGARAILSCGVRFYEGLPNGKTSTPRYPTWWPDGHELEYLTWQAAHTPQPICAYSSVVSSPGVLAGTSSTTS